MLSVLPISLITQCKCPKDFETSSEYGWDKDALKEMFYDLGILVHACSICNEKLRGDQLTTLTSNNMIREEKFVRFSPNKKMKINDTVWWADMCIQDQLKVWKEYQEKKVVFDYGTISLLEARPTVLVEHFLSIFGMDELFNVVVVDIS